MEEEEIIEIKRCILTTAILFFVFGSVAGMIFGEYIQMDSMRTTIRTQASQNEPGMNLIRFDDEYYSVSKFVVPSQLNMTWIENMKKGE